MNLLLKYNFKSKEANVSCHKRTIISESERVLRRGGIDGHALYIMFWMGWGEGEGVCWMLDVGCYISIIVRSYES